MALATSSAEFQPEKTFRAYSSDQGKVYAQTRPDYHPSLYQTVLDQHQTSGGQLDALLDIGCGPGNASRALAPQFRHALGIDPSEGMIATARSLPSSTSTGEPVRYEVSTAEELGRDLSPPVEDLSIDLIVAANAVHWFDLPRFWASAVRVLKPGGSVAVWASGGILVHPSMPNAAAIQAALDEYEESNLKPFFERGNLLTRDRYRSLPLPWTLERPIAAFDEATFFRKEWGVDEEFFAKRMEGANLDAFEKTIATASAQARWYQAHPGIAGTDKDPVKILRKEMERILHAAGAEPGKEVLKGAMKGVLLVVKKKQ